MNRHTLIYLFISLTMVSSLFGCLPPPAMEMFNVPTGVTESFTLAPTDTPAPTSTPLPTNTPAPTNTPLPTNTLAPTNTALPTNTPAPTNTALPTNIPATLAPTNTALPTNTPLPTNTLAPTNTPIPANTPTRAPAVVGVPNTGGAAPQGRTSPWILMLGALIVGGLVILAFGLRIRARRLTRW